MLTFFYLQHETLNEQVETELSHYATQQEFNGSGSGTNLPRLAQISAVETFINIPLSSVNKEWTKIPLDI